MKSLIRTSIIVSIAVLSINMSFSQQTQSRPSKSLYNLGIEINYYRSYYSGIKAISYEYMRMAFPNATFTELMADFEKLPNSQYVQDRFVYTIFGGNIAINNKVQDMLYLLSKDASASITISNYFYFRFKHPPKSVQDLKANYDYIKKENREDQAKEASNNAQRITDTDSTKTKKYLNSFNPSQEKTKVPVFNNSPQAKNSEVKQVTEEDLNEIFTSVEQVPEFQGGSDAFGRFLSKNIRYPAIARENGTQGRVIISFVCERDGSLTDVKVARGIGDGCDQEAVRVMTASPKWKPGIKNGRPVRVAYSVPITFTLGD